MLNETRRSLPLEALRAALEALLAEEGVSQTATVILVGDAMIRRLNARDRGEDEPTDVLSYPLHEPGDEGMPEIDQLGDVFVSVETAERQAPEHGRDLGEEVLALAAHGLTHLRGFDHETEAAWRMFHRAQDRALKLYREGR